MLFAPALAARGDVRWDDEGVSHVPNRRLPFLTTRPPAYTA